jgi:hypothetical protein
MCDFIIVASIVADTTLDTSRPDSIAWISIKDGTYSTSSAYKAQLIGSFPKFATSKIRRAYVEPKCTMFFWLVLHDNILMANRLAA